MDKKKAVLNVFVSVFLKLFLLIMSIIVRRYVIHILGSEINGLNSLYLNLVDILAVAELGVGEAITFCMYEPIVEGNISRVTALYSLIRKLYLAIAGIILLLGFAFLPFIPMLAKGYESSGENLYFTFIIMLISVCITYLFGAKTSLINAHRDNYVSAFIASGGKILQYILQLVALVLLQSFTAFLFCRIIVSTTQWVVTNAWAKRKYSVVISGNYAIGQSDKKDVIRRTSAMFLHKIGGILVGATDSIIISAYIGIESLGLYSNYTAIVTSMTSVLSLFFTPLISTIGHFYVQKKRDELKDYFVFFRSFNICLATVFCLGYYAVIDSLVDILFGQGLNISHDVAAVIALNHYIQLVRRASLLFRDATGMFYQDRYKSLVEGLVNLLLSLMFVQWFGIVGVLLATIITNLFICHLVEPHILFKYVFQSSPIEHYIYVYLHTVMFAVAMAVFDLLRVSKGTPLFSLLVNGAISVAISSVLCLLVYVSNEAFRTYLHRLGQSMSRHFRKNEI